MLPKRWVGALNVGSSGPAHDKTGPAVGLPVEPNLE